MQFLARCLTRLAGRSHERERKSLSAGSPSLAGATRSSGYFAAAVTLSFSSYSDLEGNFYHERAGSWRIASNLRGVASH
jgi:hypothetical protein